MNASQSRILTLCVLGLALAVRAAIVLANPGPLSEDPDAYVAIARNLADGSGFTSVGHGHHTAYRPPVYPLLLSGLFQLGGGRLAIGWMQVAIGVGTVFLTLRLGRRLDLQGGELLAAALVAVDPILVRYTVLPMTETLCAFLVTFWLWAELRVHAAARVDNTSYERTTSLWQEGIAGVLFGLCCLCRPTFLAYVGVAIVWWLIRGIVATRAAAAPSANPSRRRLLSILHAPFFIGLVLTLLPWTLRNGWVMGRFTPTTTHGGYTLLLANNPVFYHDVVLQPWGTVWGGESLSAWQQALEREMAEEHPPVQGEVARDRWMYHRAWKNIAAEPGLFLRACGWRLLRLWDVMPHGSDTSGLARWFSWGIGTFYAFIIVGLAVGACSFSRHEISQWMPLLGILLAVTLVHTIYWTDMRMRAPAIPAIALLASRGWMVIRTRFDMRR